MRHVLIISILSFYVLLIVSSCASQQPVTGGPKDTIPPTLLSTNPPNKSINFTGRKIILTFSENIKENQLNSKLIVTPDNQNKFETLIRKNSISLEFEKPFEDSTTYTLNFNSSIEDITEGNDAENVILAFSTTNYIDSLAISGTVIDLLTAEPQPDITVALYQAEDTAHIFNRRPLYFTKTSKDGFYSIENLKHGRYRLYAFHDKNKNNLCEADAEKHGFFADTISLTQNLDSIHLSVLLNDVRPLRQIASRTTGVYFETRYNKSLKDYLIAVGDSSRLTQWNLYTSLTEDLRGVIFYPYTNPKSDSLFITLTAIDSTDNAVKDSVYVKFQPSRRSRPPFSFKIAPEPKIEILPSLKLVVNFNKPVLHFAPDSIKISYDTLFSQPVKIDSSRFSPRRNQLDLFLKLDTTIVKTHRAALKQQIDSISDSTSAVYQKLLLLQQAWQKVDNKSITLAFKKASFLSVDRDTSQFQTIRYKFLNPEEKGIIRGTVASPYASFKIQLINSRFETITELPASRTFEFKNIAPGEYSLRFLIDENQDGIWSPGNSLLWQKSEPVVHYGQFFKVRANWIMENIDVEL